MLDREQAVSRRDPLRSGRIFLLASLSTLEELRHPTRDYENKKSHAGRMLLSALDCFATVKAERAIGAKACAVASFDSESEYGAYAHCSLNGSQPSLSATREIPKLTVAIATLTEALSSLMDDDSKELGRFLPLLDKVARNLGVEESN